MAREIEEEAANRLDRVIGFCDSEFEIGIQRSFGFLGKDGEVLIRGKTALCQKGESGKLQSRGRLADHSEHTEEWGAPLIRVGIAKWECCYST